MSSRSDLFRHALAERVVVADGAMGTMLQAHDPTLDDFQGHEGCNEILNVTRPDIVRARARRLLRGRRRLRRDQHLRRQPRQPRRVRHRATGSTSWPRPARRIAREVADDWTTRRPAAVGASARSARAPSCPRWATRRTPRCATPTPSRSPAWSTAASTPSSSRPPRTCCRPRPRSSAPGGRWRAAGADLPVLRPGHGRDDRHDAARQRDRRRADRAGAAGHRRSSGSTAPPARPR